MRSASGGIDISTYAQKLDVDNRIPLKIYYRIANNLLKQANIYREEKNIIDLYVLLLRFSSLVTETIPYHRDYQVLCQSEKSTFKKKLLSALNELEQLKPTAQIQIDDANRRITEVHNQIQGYQNNVNIDSSLAWPPITRQPFVKDMTQQALRHVGQIDKFQRPWNQGDRLSNSSPLEEQIRKLSLTIPRPKQETLSRHSILGPNGLRAPWQPPIVDRGVQYPSNLDLSPISMPSLHQILPDSFKEQNNIGSSTNDTCNLEAVLSLNEQERSIQVDEPCSVDAYNFDNQVTNLVRQPSPPPILAEVLDLNPTSQAQLDHSVPEPTRALQDELVSIKSPLQLHISTKMMDSFMKLAKSNTQRNLETCGILGGILKDRKFYITALIIPKQESTSDSCQATNEEEIFDVQDKQSLFPLGWIHTHPTQSCFMSSIDVHTHYSYQTMLPEAIAIVMAPRDISRTHGIFRLTTPGGMSVIRNCPLRGFHPHDEPPGGGPIYDHCADVYMNSNLDFSVIDLR